jgi:hypothetical protein
VPPAGKKLFLYLIPSGRVYIPKLPSLIGQLGTTSQQSAPFAQNSSWRSVKADSSQTKHESEPFRTKFVQFECSSLPDFGSFEPSTFDNGPSSTILKGESIMGT